MVTVAWRKFLDVTRAESSRRARELRVQAEPAPGPAEHDADTLGLHFLCAHPSLTPGSAVALTLRAVGGLTTRQIAQAYMVPEATMAQRISRAKRTVSGVRADQRGDTSTMLRVLCVVFEDGDAGDGGRRRAGRWAARPDAVAPCSARAAHPARRHAGPTR